VPVTISSVSFAIQGRGETLAVMEWLVESRRPLPASLAQGEHWHALVETNRLTGSLRAAVRTDEIVAGPTDRERSHRSQVCRGAVA